MVDIRQPFFGVTSFNEYGETIQCLNFRLNIRRVSARDWKSGRTVVSAELRHEIF